MTKFRVKETKTTRVWVAPFDDAIDPKNTAACNTLLAAMVTAKRIGHVGPLQLQYLGRAGWTDVGSPTG